LVAELRVEQGSESYQAGFGETEFGASLDMKSDVCSLLKHVKNMERMFIEL
jgi:hypothetical protein